MSTRRILYIVHNHPSVHPGGAEAYSLELYEALRGSESWDPLLVARIGTDGYAPERTSGDTVQPRRRCRRAVLRLHRDRSLRLLPPHVAGQDLLYEALRDFLRAYAPDIVHFQHTLFLGYDLVSLVRSVLPRAPILYTLHEFLAICNHHGQLVRTKDDELCLRASPRRCNECFPSTPNRSSSFGSGSSSRILLTSTSFSRRASSCATDTSSGGSRRTGFASRITAVFRWSGLRISAEMPTTGLASSGRSATSRADLLVEAMRIVGETIPDARLWLHGANLEIQTDSFQEGFRELLEEARDNVTLAGGSTTPIFRDSWRTSTGSSFPRAGGSSPLVIQEAFLHGRPVICSNIGGMAEKVRDGIDGLHFRVGDAASLAGTILKAVTTPGLWDKLRNGIPPVYSMEEHIESLGQIYEELLARRKVEAVA